MKKNYKITTKEITLCGLFTALIAVGAFIRVPLPLCPFTLQVLFVILAGLLLGPQLGSLSALMYMIIGLAGIPIFTQGGGPSYVMQPTFGYIIGFVAGAFLVGYVAQRGVPSVKRYIVACLAGLLPIYVMGMIYFYVIMNYVLATGMELSALLMSCFLLVIPGDILSCILAGFLAKRLIPVLTIYYKHKK